MRSRGSRYQFLGVLGEGGMGQVRRVYDAELGRAVAMKVILPTLLGGASLARFLDEARVGAQLQHPGIVPVHDVGRLPDGRAYFTMKEVQGQTLAEGIADAHADAREWTTRRLVGAFQRVCEAMAYAHDRGVVHRDLKPANIMLGRFGEVLVLDWGLAKVRGSVDLPAALGRLAPVRTESSLDEANRTRAGAVRGTPRYMSPEQARGEVERLGPSSDVYALGAILYAIVTGLSPFQDVATGWSVVECLRDGVAPRPPEAVTPDADPALARICTRAMAAEPEDRFEDAGALGAEVAAWLEGARQRERGLEVVADALEHLPRAAHLASRAKVLREAADRALSALGPMAPVAAKQSAWAKEDEAARLAESAAVVEAEAIAALQAALRHAPGLPEAHAALAEYYRGKHAQAEEAGRPAGAWEVHLRAYDRGEHAAYLAGTGAVTLITDPPAEVDLYRYVLRDRRLEPVFERSLGQTPLSAVPLAMGSYVAVLKAVGHIDVRYPISIGRQEHWHGVAPGETAPTPVRLPRVGELGPGEIYVPPGWFWAGGEAPGVQDWVARQRMWCDGFVLGRDPVTNAEYLAFLDALVAAGRDADALRYVPRSGLSGEGEPVYGRGDDGRFFLKPDADGDLWLPSWPVFQVDWQGARAYAAWRAERDGVPWRLASEWEWEKAARGVDGRLYPWGDTAEATWLHARGSAPAGPGVVGRPATDVSVYGVRGLAGNVGDWCLNAYDAAPTGKVVATSPEDPDRVAMRGGDWSAVVVNCRVDVRHSADPGLRPTTFGVRLARTA